MLFAGSVKTTFRCLIAAFATLAVPGAALADVPVDLRLHEAPSAPPGPVGRIRPSATPTTPTAHTYVAPPRHVAPRMKRLMARGRDKLPTCLEYVVVRCRGAGLDWTGNLILLDLDEGRDVVVTGWGASLHDGLSMSEQIITAGIRQPVFGRLWVQAGGGFAKGRMTFANLGRYDSRGAMVPAVSGAVGLDVTSTEDLDVDFAVNAATAVSELSHVDERSKLAVYNLNVGFAGRFR